MKNIIERQDESQVRYYYDEKNKITIRKECLTLHDIEDLNTVKAIFDCRGFMATCDYSENLIDKLCKNYHNILSQTRIHHTMELTTKVRCSKDDEYNKEVGKKLAQLKSNIQYGKLCSSLSEWCHVDAIAFYLAVNNYRVIAANYPIKAERKYNDFVNNLSSSKD